VSAPRSYAVRFDFPEGDSCYAGMYKGALGWAPTLATTLLYDDEEDAQRVLVNAYGNLARYGRVIVVKAGAPA
jgi:hypothetical protein